MAAIMENRDLIGEAVEQREQIVDPGRWLGHDADEEAVVERLQRRGDALALDLKIVEAVALVIGEGEQDDGDRHDAQSTDLSAACPTAVLK